jgi:hypothetical protein
MRTKILFVAVCALAVSGILRAAESTKPVSRVAVTFVQVENYTDCKDEYTDSGRAREHILAEIQGTFEKLAPRYVAEGQRLEIKVTDVDLAGDFEPWRNLGYEDIRYMREIYPPRMELEFRLIGVDGKVISEGKRKLRQAGYMMSAAFPSWDPLRYDKGMLQDWMRREFKRSS